MKLRLILFLLTLPAMKAMNDEQLAQQAVSSQATEYRDPRITQVTYLMALLYATSTSQEERQKALMAIRQLIGE